jgi:hypothetical protein
VEGQRWALVLLVVGGIILGIAVAGWPSRHNSAPLPVTTGATTTTLPTIGGDQTPATVPQATFGGAVSGGGATTIPRD